MKKNGLERKNVWLPLCLAAALAACPGPAARADQEEVWSGSGRSMAWYWRNTENHGQLDLPAEADPARSLLTLAGIPGNAYQDGELQQARFASPTGLAVQDGALLIADTDNNLLRFCSGDQVTTLAGQIRGLDAYGNAVGGYVDTDALKSQFDSPAGCIFLSSGDIAVADRDNHSIRIIEDEAVVYTLNGNGREGYAGGKRDASMFSYPSGLAEGPDGSIYVADMGNHCIRRISPDGTAALLAGVPGVSGLADGAASQALFNEPIDVAVAADGTVYVADSGNQRIRRISDGVVTTLAGGGDGFYLDTDYIEPGSADGTGSAARFYFPEGICLAGDVVVVADSGNHVIRAVAPDGQVRVIAGSGEAGYADGLLQEAQLNHPGAVAWENNWLYILDTGNSALRRMYFSPEEWLRSLTVPAE